MAIVRENWSAQNRQNQSYVSISGINPSIGDVLVYLVATDRDTGGPFVNDIWSNDGVSWRRLTTEIRSAGPVSMEVWFGYCYNTPSGSTWQANFSFTDDSAGILLHYSGVDRDGVDTVVTVNDYGSTLRFGPVQARSDEQAWLGLAAIHDSASLTSPTNGFSIIHDTSGQPLTGALEKLVTSADTAECECQTTGGSDDWCTAMVCLSSTPLCPYRVQDASDSQVGVTSVNPVLSATPSAGNSLLCFVANGHQITPPTDLVSSISSPGATWERLHKEQHPLGYQVVEVWIAKDISGTIGGESVTVNLTGTHDAIAFLGEYAGVVSPYVDRIDANTDNSDTPSIQAAGPQSVGQELWALGITAGETAWDDPTNAGEIIFQDNFVGKTGLAFLEAGRSQIGDDDPELGCEQADVRDWSAVMVTLVGGRAPRISVVQSKEVTFDNVDAFTIIMDAPVTPGNVVVVMVGQSNRPDEITGPGDWRGVSNVYAGKTAAFHFVASGNDEGSFNYRSCVDIYSWVASTGETNFVVYLADVDRDGVEAIAVEYTGFSDPDGLIWDTWATNYGNGSALSVGPASTTRTLEQLWIGALHHRDINAGLGSYDEGFSEFAQITQSGSNNGTLAYLTKNVFTSGTPETGGTASVGSDNWSAVVAALSADRIDAPGTARIQEAENVIAPGDTITLTFGVAPTDGNTLVAVVSYRADFAQSVTGITHAGATWTQISTHTSTTDLSTIEVWAASNVQSAAISLVINMSSSVDAVAVGMEYSGVREVAFLDQESYTELSATGSPYTPTVSPLQKQEQHVAIFAGYGVGTAGTPDDSTFDLVHEYSSTEIILSVYDKDAGLLDDTLLQMSGAFSIPWHTGILTLRATRSQGSISRRQELTAGGTGEPSYLDVTLPVSPQDGSNLIMAIATRWGGTNQNVDEIVQTGAVWKRLYHLGKSWGQHLEIWMASDVQSASDAIHVDLIQAAEVAVSVAEYVGIDHTQPIDVITSKIVNNLTTAGTSTPNMDTLSDDEVYFAALFSGAESLTHSGSYDPIGEVFVDEVEKIHLNTYDDFAPDAGIRPECLVSVSGAGDRVVGILIGLSAVALPKIRRGEVWTVGKDSSTGNYLDIPFGTDPVPKVGNDLIMVVGGQGKFPAGWVGTTTPDVFEWEHLKVFGGHPQTISIWKARVKEEFSGTVQVEGADGATALIATEYQGLKEYTEPFTEWDDEDEGDDPPPGPALAGDILGKSRQLDHMLLVGGVVAERGEVTWSNPSGGFSLVDQVQSDPAASDTDENTTAYLEKIVDSVADEATGADFAGSYPDYRWVGIMVSLYPQADYEDADGVANAALTPNVTGRLSVFARGAASPELTATATARVSSRIQTSVQCELDATSSMVAELSVSGSADAELSAQATPHKVHHAHGVANLQLTVAAEVSLLLPYPLPGFPRSRGVSGEVAAHEMTAVKLIADSGSDNRLEVLSLSRFVKVAGAPDYDFGVPPDPLAPTPKLGCVPGDQIVLTDSIPPGGVNVGKTFTLRHPDDIEVYEKILDDPGVEYEFYIVRRAG